MKLIPVLVIVLAVLFAACSDSEEPVVNQEADVSVAVVEEEAVADEVIEVVEEEAAPGQLPEYWPQGFILPENMIVVEEFDEVAGVSSPAVIVQFIEGVEPLPMSDLYNHFYEGAVGEGWTVPVPDQNDCYSTSADFYVAVYHSEHRYMTIEGYNDSETIPTLKISWLGFGQ